MDLSKSWEHRRASIGSHCNILCLDNILMSHKRCGCVSSNSDSNLAGSHVSCGNSGRKISSPGDNHFSWTSSQS